MNRRELRRTTVVMMALLAAGCCGSNKFPRGATGPFNVGRDDYVEQWYVNGDEVCQKLVLAGPGCYVFDVQYGAKYAKAMKGSGPPYFSGLLHPVFPLAEEEANTHRAEYHSPNVRFVLPVEPDRAYFVTATFTGDVFLPRVVVTDAIGERLGEILPARSGRELEDCRAGTLRAPAPGVPPSGGEASRRSFLPHFARPTAAPVLGCRG